MIKREVTRHESPGGRILRIVPVLGVAKLVLMFACKTFPRCST